MTGTFITLEKAAGLEGISYKGFSQRVNRNPEQYSIKRESNISGGKQRILIDISSLSPEAKKKFFQDIKDIEAAKNISQGSNHKVNLAELEAFVGTKRYRELIKQAEEEAASAIEYLKFDSLWGNKKDLMNRIADQYDISTRTLHRRVQTFKEGGTIALIRIPNKFFHKQFISRPSIEKEVEEFIRAEYLQLYGPKPAQIKTKVDVFCELKELTAPSKDTVYRYIRDMDKYEPDLVCLGREGEEAYEKKFGYKAHRNDPNIANQVWEGDHHRCDFFVEYNGKAVRPWMTVWFDVATRTVRGFTLAINANGRTITTALRHGILKKKLSKFNTRESREIVLRTMARLGMIPKKMEELSELDLPIYGLPQELYIDNGEDYKAAVKKGTKHQGWEYSSEIRNFCEMIDISVRFCTKYHPWAKGHCERWFWTFSDMFCRYFPGYCGNDNKQRPAGLNEQSMAEREQLLTMDEAYMMIEYCVHTYHNREHGSLGVSPFEKVADLPLARTEMPNERELDICLMDVDKAKVGKTGIQKFGTRGNSRVYSHPALDKYIGQDIVVRYDPNRIGELLCFDPKRAGQYICTATNDQALDFGASKDDIEQLRKRQSRNKKEIKSRLKSQRQNTLENIVMERTYAGEKTISGTIQHPETNIPMITPMAQAAKKRTKRTPKPDKPLQMAVNGEQTLSTFDQYMINKGKELK